MEAKLSKGGSVEFQTTESADNFNEKAELFLGLKVNAQTIHL